MSKFRKIDRVGWWEDELGHRFHVVHLRYGCGFFVTMKRGQIQPSGFVIKDTAPCRYLPDCTGWDWEEPEPVKEIEFPDEVDSSIQWIVICENGNVGLCRSEPKHAQYGGWAGVVCWVPHQIKLRGIPTLADVGGDWKKATWKRKEA
jgi:hypothetical protein